MDVEENVAQDVGRGRAAGVGVLGEDRVGALGRVPRLVGDDPGVLVLAAVARVELRRSGLRGEAQRGQADAARGAVRAGGVDHAAPDDLQVRRTPRDVVHDLSVGLRGDVPRAQDEVRREDVAVVREREREQRDLHRRHGEHPLADRGVGGVAGRPRDAVARVRLLPRGVGQDAGGGGDAERGRGAEAERGVGVAQAALPAEGEAAFDEERVARDGERALDGDPAVARAVRAAQVDPVPVEAALADELRVGADRARAERGEGDGGLHDGAGRIRAGERPVQERPFRVLVQLAPGGGGERRNEAREVVARRARKGEHLAVPGVQDDCRAAAVAERALGGALQPGVDREDDVAALDGVRGGIGLALVAEHVDAEHLGAAAAGEDAVERLLDAPAPEQLVRGVVERRGAGLVGAGLGGVGVRRVGRRGAVGVDVAPGVADHVARQVPERIHAVLLDDDVDAGERIGPFGEARELVGREVAVGDERDRPALPEVAPDRVAVQLGLAPDDEREVPRPGEDLLHGVGPAAGRAQLVEVERGAVARAVVGEDGAVAVEDPAARGREPHAAQRHLGLLAEVAVPVAHLDVVQAEQEERERPEHRGAERGEAQARPERASPSRALHGRPPRVRC